MDRRYHSVVLTASGRVLTFGAAQLGQLGRATPAGSADKSGLPVDATPRQVEGLPPSEHDPVARVAAGFYNTLVACGWLLCRVTAVHCGGSVWRPLSLLLISPLAACTAGVPLGGTVLRRGEPEPPVRRGGAAEPAPYAPGRGPRTAQHRRRQRWPVGVTQGRQTEAPPRAPEHRSPALGPSSPATLHSLPSVSSVSPCTLSQATATRWRSPQTAPCSRSVAPTTVSGGMAANRRTQQGRQCRRSIYPGENAQCRLPPVRTIRWCLARAAQSSRSAPTKSVSAASLRLPSLAVEHTMATMTTTTMMTTMVVGLCWHQRQ